MGKVSELFQTAFVSYTALTFRDFAEVLFAKAKGFGTVPKTTSSIDRGVITIPGTPYKTLRNSD